MKNTFEAKLPHLHSMLAYVRMRLNEFPLSKQDVHRLELVLEELLVNIIEHAYDGKMGQIEIGYERAGDAVHVTISDDGKPFNPLAHNVDTQKDLPLEARKPGGLGIHIAKTYMDDISYTRRDDKNIIRLTKHTATAS